MTVWRNKEKEKEKEKRKKEERRKKELLSVFCREISMNLLDLCCKEDCCSRNYNSLGAVVSQRTLHHVLRMRLGMSLAGVSSRRSARPTQTNMTRQHRQHPVTLLIIRTKNTSGYSCRYRACSILLLSTVHKGGSISFCVQTSQGEPFPFTFYDRVHMHTCIR